MRLELRRMTAELIFEQPWLTVARTIIERYREAKDALAGGDAVPLRPKAEYDPNAPEEVRIFDDEGELVARYDLAHFIAEARRALAAPTAPAACRAAVNRDRQREP